MSAVAVEPGCTRRTTLLADGSTDSRPRPESRIFVAASPSLAERDPKRAFVGGGFAQALTFALGDVDKEELVPTFPKRQRLAPIVPKRQETCKALCRKSAPRWISANRTACGESL